MNLFEIQISIECIFENKSVNMGDVLADKDYSEHADNRESARVLWEYIRYKFVSTMWDMKENLYVLENIRKSIQTLSNRIKWNFDQCKQACELMWATLDHTSYARRAINLDSTFMEGVLSGMTDKTVFSDAIICNYWFWKVGLKYLNYGANEHDKISELHNTAQSFFIRTRDKDIEKNELHVVRIRKITVLLKEMYKSETKFIGSLIELQILVNKLI
jgi:hypothetical protein